MSDLVLNFTITDPMRIAGAEWAMAQYNDANQDRAEAGDSSRPGEAASPAVFETVQEYLAWAWADRAMESYAVQAGLRNR